MSCISKRVGIRIGRGISVEEIEKSIEEMLDACVAEELTRFLRVLRLGSVPSPANHCNHLRGHTHHSH